MIREEVTVQCTLLTLTTLWMQRRERWIKVKSGWLIEFNFLKKANLANKGRLVGHPGDRSWGLKTGKWWIKDIASIGMREGTNTGQNNTKSQSEECSLSSRMWSFPNSPIKLQDYLYIGTESLHWNVNSPEWTSHQNWSEKSSSYQNRTKGNMKYSQNLRKCTGTVTNI